MAKASITSPRCTVCTHAERIVIDNLLATGAEARATGRRFGLSKDAISRHFRDHVSDTWKVAMKVGPYGSASELAKLCAEEGISVVQGLRALYSSYHALFVANRETGAVGATIMVGREMRAVLTDLARISGELMPAAANISVTNNFNSVTYLAGLGEELVAEFADMPAALTKLEHLLQRRMTAALPSPEALEGELVHAA
jgi:hypothetical protein